MATYGKKKKGLLSSFSVFQDDKPNDNVNQQPSNSKRPVKAKTLMQRSRGKARVDESSGDELADTAILYGVPHGPGRLPSLQDLRAISSEDITHPQSLKSTKTLKELERPESSMSTKSMDEDDDKALPSVLSQDTHEIQRKHGQHRPALANKTTNMKATTSKTKQGEKPQISPPVHQETTNTSISVSDSSRSLTSHTIQGGLGSQTSTADAAELSTKISNLMAQAAAQEEQTKLKSDAYAVASAKLSPLLRGKNAFVKATRAIKERLSNSSIDKTLTTKRPPMKRHSSYQEASPLNLRPGHGYVELSRGRLDRRIAEGENLSNPKIRSLTGDGSIPRRPLPVYESMRSRSMRSDSAEDPFSDGKDGDNFLPPQDYSGFDFDFSKRRHKTKADGSPQTLAPGQDQTDSLSGISSQHLAVPGSTSGFSNLISGLAQHPDVMHFSSSPLGHSTPRIRLETQMEADANCPNKRLLTRSPSILEFSFEDQSDDTSFETASQRGHNNRASDSSTLSVKRKGATDDLRGQLTPAAKKARTDSTDSKEDLGVLAGISDLETGGERGSLSPTLSKEERPKEDRNAGKRRGMGIFDIGKGKAPEKREEDELTGHSHARPKAIKRSSFGRPSSVLFSRGRNSWSGNHQLTQADDDAMDIDELQVEDATYLMGGKKR